MKSNQKVFTLSIALAITVIALIMVLVLRNVDAGDKDGDISADQAKTIALQDAGVADDEVTFTKCAPDTEDGTSVYDIVFYTDDTDYEYLVESGTGSIYSKEKTYNASAKPSGDGVPADDDATVYIGTEKAKEIALADAGLSEASFEKAKLDHDEGMSVYEIEFKANGKEYEYEIDAVSGDILDSDIEDDND